MRRLRPILGTSVSAALLLGASSLAAAACSNTELTSISPDREQVVAAYVDTGLSEAVAGCVVGMGERQFDLAELDPSQPTPKETQQLVDEFILSCVEASQLRDTSFDEPPSLAFSSEPDVFGDDSALDALWTACEVGDGSACDELWETAPIGSGYEQFGVTCGERFDVLDCSEELQVEE